jgi:hypothetical protein
VPVATQAAPLDRIETVDAIAVRAVDAYGQLGPVNVWLKTAGK